MLADVPMVFILIGLTAYTVLAGADFGAGLWTLADAGGTVSRAATREHTRHAMGPVWEANHVWLIFVLTVCWTAYPAAFGSVTSTLAIPLFIAAIGIIFRGSAYALRSQLERDGRGVRTVENLFAVSSVLTPFALGTVGGGIASGRVPPGNAQGNVITAWLNPVSVVIGALAVAFSAYLAAVYLAADARRLGERPLERDFRARALGTGIVAGALALAGLLVLRAGARPIWDGLTAGTGLALVCVSAVAGLATMALVWRGRFSPARASAALAVAAVVAGWAAAQQPRFLPGLTVAQAAAGRATLVATVISVAIGAVVLVPSLALLFGLFLRGRLDTGQPPAAPRWPAPATALSPAGGAAVPGGTTAAGSIAPAGSIEPAGARPAASAAAGLRARLAAALSAVCVVVGAGLLVFSDANWAHAVGVVCLLVAATPVFAMAAASPAADGG